MVSEPLLEARSLGVVRPGDDGPLTVLDRVDLAVAAGEVLDVSGPSGSGKSTLLRALARMLPGVTGELLLEGTPASAFTPRVWRTRVALASQQAVIVPGSVADNLLLPWTLKVRAEAVRPTGDELRSALDSVGLTDVALERDSARLSVGQAARLALVRVVLTRPDVLLLDEPDANLDDESAGHVCTLIARFAEGGGAVVRVRHRRPDAIASRKVRLACGLLEEVPDGR